MTFAQPAWLHLAWVVAAILLMRWFVLGRRTERTSTLMLWRRLLSETPARARGRLRPDAESAVEALLGLVLVALVAGPGLDVAADRAPFVIVDAGAAMQAPGRRAVVDRITSELASGATVERTADVGRALAAARALRGRRIVVVADALELEAPDRVEVVIADAPVANVGITVAEARRQGDGVDVLVVLESSGPEGAVRLDFVRDGRAIASVPATVSAAAPTELVIRIPGDAGFTVELVVGLANEIAEDDVVRFAPPPEPGFAQVGAGLDAFADALGALGIATVEVGGEVAPGAGGLIVARSLPDGGHRAILVPPARGALPRLAAEAPGGPLDAAAPELDDVPLGGVSCGSFREVVGGRPLLRVGDRVAAAVDDAGRVVVLGFEPTAPLTERPEFALLVRAFLEIAGFEGGGEGALDYGVSGVLDAEETLARATPAAARPGEGVGAVEETRSLRAWNAALALLLLGLLAWIRSAR